MHFTGSNAHPPSVCMSGPVSRCLIGRQEVGVDSTALRFDLNVTALQVPSENILRAGRILRNAIVSRAPHMIRDRKYHLKTYRLALTSSVGCSCNSLILYICYPSG